MATVSTKVRNHVQTVRTAPEYVFSESYLTKKGQRLMNQHKTQEEADEIVLKYQKNRYKKNPDSKVLYEWVNGKYVPATRYFGVKKPKFI